MDCATVKDSECFSTNSTGGEVDEVCTKAEEAQSELETPAPDGGGGGSTPTPAPGGGGGSTTSSADSFMTSLVQWTVLVSGVGFVVW